MYISRNRSWNEINYIESELFRESHISSHIFLVKPTPPSPFRALCNEHPRVPIVHFTPIKQLWVEEDLFIRERGISRVNCLTEGGTDTSRYRSTVLDNATSARMFLLDLWKLSR